MSFDFTDAPVTLLLLLINGLVSCYALYFDSSLLERLGFRPVRIRADGEWYRFITGGFVHVAWWHLAFNLITLYYFGPALEARLGSLAFLVLYFGSELAAHALTFKAHKSDASYNAVGASGAISGVLFGYCLFEPFSLLFIMGVIPVPAIVFAVGFVVISLRAMKRGQLGGIAHEAHLGGAIGGVLLTIALEPDALRIFLGHFGL